MKVLTYIAILVAGFSIIGCSAQPRAESVDPKQALASPHQVSISLNKQSAQAGETLQATITFTNTGTIDLWVPTRNQTFLGYIHEGGEESFEWQSSCGGLKYVRLKPGRSLTYLKPFKVPELPGRMKVYVTDAKGSFTTLLAFQ